jgi:putative transposase
LAKKGSDALPGLLHILMNIAMSEERFKYLHAAEYERTEDRAGYANQRTPKTVWIQIGEITFALPQVREGGFFSSCACLRLISALFIEISEE